MQPETAHRGHPDPDPTVADPSNRPAAGNPTPDQADTQPRTSTSTATGRSAPNRSALTRVAMATLLAVVAVLLAVVIATPIALSSQDLIDWAAAPTGLDLPKPWPVGVFIALDAAAAVCVLLTVYCAWRGEPAGIFGVLVWCFAAGSAFANWRHATTPGAPPDAIWFFPLMSLAGPTLLEAVLGRFRRWVQRDTGRRGRPVPSFGWRRWTPGLGAFTDTYGAYRTALLLGIDTVETAITAYHQLCPDGSIKVATALRHRNATHTHQPHGGNPQPAAPGDHNTELPVDLMRRIPVQHEPYQRWRTVWDELRNAQSLNLKDIAERHRFSVRQVEFIRRAGQARLLDSPIPPALRLAAAATTTDTPDPASSNGNPSSADAASP